MAFLIAFLLFFTNIAVGSTNIGPLYSSISASSETVNTSQLASKAVDGVVDGYPGDYTKEWATMGGKAGSWIRLDWSSAYTVDQVVLYDRPNLSDQVLSGTLLFSDGTSVPVGVLPNNASPLTVTFAPRTVTWVKFTVNSVSSTTRNVGLAELQVYSNIDAAPTKASIMIVAAHPDDETLWGAGVMKRALDNNDSVKVVIVTNGDAGTNGLTREAESKAALADKLGLNVNDIIFLGYPDAGLQSLYNDYPTVDDGRYTSRAGMMNTYGNQGLGNRDFHSYETGTAGGYNRATLEADLQAPLQRYRPSVIYTHSPADQHPDHRIVFYAIRDEVIALMKADPQFRPNVYITTVHDPVNYPFVDRWAKGAGTPQTQDPGAGDGVWPNPSFSGTSGNATDMRARFTPTQAFVEPSNLAKTPYAWSDRTRFPVPAVMQDSNLANNLKYQMIDGYVSQRKTVGLIYAFGKNEEVFWRQDWLRNIAMIATITASSQNTANFQQAANVADSVPDGTPGNSQAEWVTQGEGAGAWVQMDWPWAHTVNQIVLYDRPNTNDQVLSGILTFSDGTSMAVTPMGGLPNGGQAYAINIAPSKAITWVRFTVDTVSGTTTNIGLAEMKVLEVPPNVVNHAPYFTRGPTAQSYTLTNSATTALSAPAYDADGDSLTYTWKTQLGMIIGSGATVTYQAPATVTGLDIVTVSTSDGTNLPVSASFAINVLSNVDTNIAPLYSAITFSSQNTSTGQLALKAVDGVVDGYPGDYTKEWATMGGKAGSWIRLDWSSAYTVDQVVLYDRPNLSDQVLSGTLLFSDGTSVPVGVLPNNASPLTVTFAPRTVTWVKFTVNSTSSTTQNIGLAEIQIYGNTLGITNYAPSITSGPTATPTNISTNQTAQLTIVASDPNGDPLTYTWQPSSGTITGNGSTVIFNPPIVSTDTVVRINVTVSDPGGLSATGHVDVTVSNATGASPVNVAGSATVSASSQNTDTGQLAIKAVDGVVNGYPGDYTKEWATVKGKTGSWIRLDLPLATTVYYVTLYDRPNLSDQVLSGTLLFSDGTSVPVGVLPNNASALTVSFIPRTVSWVKFTVNSVSSTTANIGLAELQVYAIPPN